MAETKRTIRWGILGAGDILNAWMAGARQVEDMEVVAVASRTPQRAEAMAKKLEIPDALSYEALLAREDIDAVYIPVPHTAHKGLALQALRAGKAVLVEKPATVTAAEFEELTECAKEQNMFLMEAIWTRFFPLAKALPEYFGENGIGEVRSIHSSFAFRCGDERVGGRLTDPMTAGGSLLDTGVYDLHFTDLILDKEPVQIVGLAAFDTDDLHLQVDEQASYVAKFNRGELAVMTSAIRTTIPDTAYIYGTKGYIEIPHFWKPTEMTVRIGDDERVIQMPVPQKVDGVTDVGYQFEVEHVNECLRNGLIQSPVVPWENTLRVLRQCDKLRADWNFKYPFEVK